MLMLMLSSQRRFTSYVSDDESPADSSNHVVVLHLLDA